jgi:pilus assembly protein TadC
MKDSIVKPIHTKRQEKTTMTNQIFPDSPLENGDTIDVIFELRKEGNDKVTYAEILPKGVVGGFYLSRIAALFKWGTIPEQIQITIQRADL